MYDDSYLDLESEVKVSINQSIKAFVARSANITAPFIPAKVLRSLKFD